MRDLSSDVNAPPTDQNKVQSADRAVHEWYRFVLSFPPHLVQTYLHRFRAGSFDTVLDPFCGTGTTLVECKKSGIPSVGIEPNPMARFASGVNRLVDQRRPAPAIRRNRRFVSKNGLGATGYWRMEQPSALHDSWRTPLPSPRPPCRAVKAAAEEFDQPAPPAQDVGALGSHTQARWSAGATMWASCSRQRARESHWQSEIRAGGRRRPSQTRRAGSRHLDRCHAHDRRRH